MYVANVQRDAGLLAVEVDIDRPDSLRPNQRNFGDFLAHSRVVQER